MNLTLIEAPLTSNNDSPETFRRAEPVLVTDLQTHSRLPSNLVPPAADPAYLEQLIAAARELFEAETHLQLLTATWELRLDNFPLSGGPVYLPIAPAQELLSVKYLDTDGVEQTLYDSTVSPAIDEGVLEVDLKSPARPEAGQIYLAYNQSWPSPRSEKNAVRIRFKAGFGASPADVPNGIKQWILIQAATMHENREAEFTGTIRASFVFVPALLDRWRWRRPVF